MIAMAETRLKQLRTEVGLTQEALARRTRTINLRTYLRAEKGESGVKYNTAVEILDALNAIRGEKGLDPLKLEDLVLTIY